MKKIPQDGFTLIEIVVAIAIFALLSGVATINLLSAQHKASLQGQIATLLADAKQQQLKAMEGDTDGRTNPDYDGVHFTTNSYTLFHGTIFNPDDSTNITFPLETNLQFSTITFPNNNLIFIPLSGEVYGYSNVTNTITLEDTTSNEQKQLQFNYLGVLTGIN